ERQRGDEQRQGQLARGEADLERRQERREGAGEEVVAEVREEEERREGGTRHLQPVSAAHRASLSPTGGRWASRAPAPRRVGASSDRRPAPGVPGARSVGGACV